MQIGQKIFNLEDRSGRIFPETSIPSNVNNDYTIFPSGNTPIKIIKLGIQAPENTKFIINNKNIRIGPNEVYELYENGIIITSLKISRESLSAHNIIIDYIEE